MKKITSMFMAVAMILALTVSAFGVSIAGTGSGNSTTGSGLTYNTTFTGEYQANMIEVSLPNNVALVLNPYRLQYTATTTHSADDSAFLVDKLADQLFSAPLTIASRSNIALKVNMEVLPIIADRTGNDEDKLTLVPEATLTEADEAAKQAGVGTSKFVSLSLSYGLVDGPNVAPTGDEKKTMELIDTAQATTVETLQLAAIGDNTGEEWFVTIPPAIGTGAVEYFGFQFNGKTAVNVLRPYDENDKVSATIAFTFIPVANEDDQIQGGEFYYTYAAENGSTPASISERSDSTDGKDTNNVTVPLIGTLTTSSARTVNNATLSNYLTYLATNSAQSRTAGVSVNADGELVISKDLLLKHGDYAQVAKGTSKYAVVVPVDFDVQSGTGSAVITDHITCNVRIIMCPIAA